MDHHGYNKFADRSAELMTALANSKRIAILGYLLNSELSVNDIADRVALSQSALSQHLAKLRSLNLVKTRRDRQMIYYSCNSLKVRRVYETLQELFKESTVPHQSTKSALIPH